MNCQFCMTALLGLLRNLSAGEIVGQVLRVLQDQKVSPESERINLVFMGQGEPFLNYENFMKAVRLLVAGVGIPESRMTVSTAGIVPRIRDFGGEQVRPKLAISLNASNDETRDQVMPINRKWNLATLLDGRAPVSAAATRTTYVRICSAERRQRQRAERARGRRPDSRPERQGQPDRAQPGAGDSVLYAGGRARPRLPADAHPGRHPHLYSPSARARHLRRLRTTQARRSRAD